MSSGEMRYMTRCIDKLGFAFRGDESLLDVGCGNGRVARLLPPALSFVEKGLSAIPALTPHGRYVLAVGYR